MFATASITNHARWSSGQPFAHVRRQQERLLRVSFDEVLGHTRSLFGPADGALCATASNGCATLALVEPRCRYFTIRGGSGSGPQDGQQACASSNSAASARLPQSPPDRKPTSTSGYRFCRRLRKPSANHPSPSRANFAHAHVLGTPGSRPERPACTPRSAVFFTASKAPALHCPIATRWPAAASLALPASRSPSHAAPQIAAWSLPD
jgi:hypothetical protein